jgi:hypothetical protein
VCAWRWRTLLSLAEMSHSLSLSFFLSFAIRDCVVATPITTKTLINFDPNPNYFYPGPDISIIVGKSGHISGQDDEHGDNQIKLFIVF